VAGPLRRGGERHEALREGARIELGIRRFLEAGNFKGFTTTFEDLHGLGQLPGSGRSASWPRGTASRRGRLEDAALVRAMKVMAAGLDGGTSFMEDYTYHLSPDGMKVLGAHMLEICPTLAATRPRLEAHPLGIGGKADPVRLVFDARRAPRSTPRSSRWATATA
jgi:L-arabinose isomerase